VGFSETGPNQTGPIRSSFREARFVAQPYRACAHFNGEPASSVRWLSKCTPVLLELLVSPGGPLLSSRREWPVPMTAPAAALPPAAPIAAPAAAPLALLAEPLLLCCCWPCFRCCWVCCCVCAAGGACAAGGVCTEVWGNTAVATARNHQHHSFCWMSHLPSFEAFLCFGPAMRTEGKPLPNLDFSPCYCRCFIKREFTPRCPLVTHVGLRCVERLKDLIACGKPHLFAFGSR
jgi:hypothetical protein